MHRRLRNIGIGTLILAGTRWVNHKYWQIPNVQTGLSGQAIRHLALAVPQIIMDAKLSAIIDEWKMYVRTNWLSPTEDVLANMVDSY